MIIKDETIVRKTVEIDCLAIRYERHSDFIRLFNQSELLIEIPASQELEFSKLLSALSGIAAEAPIKKPGRKSGFKLKKITEEDDDRHIDVPEQ